MDSQELVSRRSTTFAVAATCDKEQFLQSMKQVEQGGIGYVEMSEALAANGVEKWTFTRKS